MIHNFGGVIVEHLKDYKEFILGSDELIFPADYRIDGELRELLSNPDNVSRAEWLRSIDAMIYGFEHKGLNDDKVKWGRDLFITRFNDLKWS